MSETNEDQAKAPVGGEQPKTEPSYTPGPYIYVRGSDGCNDTWDIIAEPSDEKIVSIHFWDDGDGAKFREHEPNARVLAAAPELLESLGLLLDMIARHRITVSGTEACLAVCAARYVVGKATGTHYEPRPEWRLARD